MTQEYRILKKGEIIKTGDQFETKGVKPAKRDWWLCKSTVGQRVGDPGDPADCVFRRARTAKVKKVAAKEQYRPLVNGDRFQTGDEMRGPGNKWKDCPSSMFGGTYDNATFACQYRRKVGVTPPTKPAEPTVLPKTYEVGEGYRLLKLGETIKDTDEFTSSFSGEWFKCMTRAGDEVYSGDTAVGRKWRRKLEKKPQKIFTGDRVFVTDKNNRFFGAGGQVVGTSHCGENPICKVRYDVAQDKEGYVYSWYLESELSGSAPVKATVPTKFKAGDKVLINSSVLALNGLGTIVKMNDTGYDFVVKVHHKNEITFCFYEKELTLTAKPAEPKQEVTKEELYNLIYKGLTIYYYNNHYRANEVADNILKLIKEKQ